MVAMQTLTSSKTPSFDKDIYYWLLCLFCASRPSDEIDIYFHVKKQQHLKYLHIILVQFI